MDKRLPIRFITSKLILFGQDHSIDDVDHTVGALNVCFDHFGIVDHNGSIFHHKSNVFAINGGGGIHTHDIFSHNFAGNNMIGQNGFKLIRVFRN